MTDAFLPIDAVLWSLAVALLALVLWLTRRAADEDWDPAVLFGGALSASFGKGRLPLTGGPVPPEGWDGAAEDLGDAYDPGRRIGPGLDWAALGVVGEGAPPALARRLEGVRLVWFEPPVAAVEGLAPVVCAPEEVAALLARPEDRFVLAASAAAASALAWLHDAPALRDRLRAVLLVAPALDRAWLEAHFTHAGFDVEVARRVPYLTLRSPPDDDAQLLPDPPLPASGLVSLAVVDLGVLPREALDDPRVARALAVVVAALA